MGIAYPARRVYGVDERTSGEMLVDRPWDDDDNMMVFLKQLMQQKNIDVGPTNLWSYTSDETARHLAYKADASPTFIELVRNVVEALWETDFKTVMDAHMEDHLRESIVHHKKHPKISITILPEKISATSMIWRGVRIGGLTSIEKMWVDCLLLEIFVGFESDVKLSQFKDAYS